MAQLISSDPSTVPYTATFLRIVAAASPVYLLATVMAMLLRTDSCIKLSSIALSLAGIANVLFDLLFMGVLGMGVEGSALATDSGIVVSYSNANHMWFDVSEDDGGALHVVLADDGSPFDPTSAVLAEKEFESLDSGGMGIGLVRQLASDLHYRREADRNILVIVMTSDTA